MTPVLVAILLQMLVGEAGLAAERDHRAMLFGIHKLSRGGDVAETVYRHIPRMHHGVWWQESKPWIGWLDATCDKPPNYPSRWEGANQHLCFAIVARIRDYHAGRLKNPCKGVPDQWRKSGRSCPKGDRRLKCMRRVRKVNRVARLRYRQIGCSATLHNYYDTGGGT